MKFKSLFFSALCMLIIGVSFTACSDNEAYLSKSDKGSIITLPQDRVFILNEGSFEKNNAGITFYDPVGNTDKVNDIFYKQNRAKLGDTGQDIIEYSGNIFVSVYGSKYITRLNTAGVEQARYAFTEEQGQPRYMTASDGKIYVTLYSGNVARLDAKTLNLEKMVKVGNNPEYIIEKDGKLYCLNSGWGKDNRLSIIDINTFETAENVEVFTNPDQIVKVGNHIIIQGYGANYEYPIAVFDPVQKNFKEIGNGTKIASYNGLLYVVYSNTDWSTHTTTNTFYTYNPTTGKKSESSFLKNAPAELESTSIYMLSINPQNGDIYIGTSNYDTNGDIYRFKNDGTFIKKFESGGLNPKKAIFFY